MPRKNTRRARCGEDLIYRRSKERLAEVSVAQCRKGFHRHKGISILLRNSMLSSKEKKRHLGKAPLREEKNVKVLVSFLSKKVCYRARPRRVTRRRGIIQRKRRSLPPRKVLSQKKGFGGFRKQGFREPCGTGGKKSLDGLRRGGGNTLKNVCKGGL